MENKIYTIGAYVVGILDAATSRGELTQAAKDTMLKGALSLYGGGHDPFQTQQQATATRAHNQLVENALTGEFRELLVALDERQKESDQKLAEMMQQQQRFQKG